MTARQLTNPKEIGRGYDSIVARYESEFVNARIDGKWLALFRAKLPVDATVLDLGCGPGLQSEVLTKLGCSCTGIDVSAKMIGAATRRVPTGHFSLGSFLDIDGVSGRFDGVLISYSLLHVPQRKAKLVLSQCRRVLKSGGLLALFLKEGTGERHLDTPLMGNVQLFTCLWTQSAIMKALSALGFSILHARLAPPESNVEFQYRKLFILARLRHTDGVRKQRNRV